MISNRRSALHRYTVAVLLAAVALGIRAVLATPRGPDEPFVLAYAGVMLAAWYGGFGPGLVTTLLSVAGVALLLEPRWRFAIGTGQIMGFVLFVCSGVFTSALIELLHRRRRQVEQHVDNQRRTEALLRDTVAALAERERVLDAAQRLALIGSWELDLDDAQHPERNAQRWSAETYRIFGYEPDTVAASGALFMRHLHPDDRARVRARFAEAVSEREEFTIEHRLLLPDGGERWVEQRGRIVFDTDGRATRMLGTCQDVTARKRAETELRERDARLYASEQQARAQAEASDRAKDQFLAVLSHELRTPLTPVVTAAQLLGSAPVERDPARVQALATVIRKNAELEARLIDDLLDLTRIDRGKLSLNVELVDAHAKVHEVLAACAPDIEAKRLRVQLELRARSHHVHADSLRLQQVISNLVRNAVKFSHDDGRITVTTRDGGAGALVLEVRDEGVGIETALLPRVFNAFEQGSREFTRRFGGLGLGLSVSKALIEAQGGSISAASSGPDRGATFTIELPSST